MFPDYIRFKQGASLTGKNEICTLVVIEGYSL